MTTRISLIDEHTPSPCSASSTHPPNFPQARV
jgi:hypothetical protein